METLAQQIELSSLVVLQNSESLRLIAITSTVVISVKNRLQQPDQQKKKKCTKL